MKIVVSVPSGYHARELLLPLYEHFEQDNDIEAVHCISPAAPFHQELFPEISDPIHWHENPAMPAGYDHLMQSLQPDIVITDTNGLDELDIPILKAAKGNGIRTLTFIASWDNIWKIERHQKQGLPQENADNFIVWNQMMQEHLLRIYPELSTDKVKIIGAPRFDFFHHANRIPSRSDLLDYLKLPDDGSKLIHFATTELYPMDYIVKTIAKARDTSKLTFPVHLYASVHPGGDMIKHKKYANQYNVTTRYSFGRRQQSPHPNFLYSPKLKDIYMLIALFKHADLLINQSSTVAIESFAGNTPVINVKYGRPFDWHAWTKSAVARDFKEHYRDILIDSPSKIVRHKSKLVPATNDYLQDPTQDEENRAKNLKRMTTITNGTASASVLNYIKAIVREA